MKIKLLFLAGCVATLLFSCAKNNIEDLKPVNNSGCDTASVTYSGFVVPMIQKYSCKACHTTGSGLISLDTRTDVMNNSAAILRAIKHDPSLSQTKWMPSGGNKLTDCEISQFQAWINKGFPQ